ncbi:MAG: BON domain-containing protein, partial [Prosthecobacter sp.]
MNRARWITSAATFLALWLLGALVLAPGLKGRLETAAHAALAGESSLHGRLGRLTLAFEGQQARLSGTVRTERDRETAARIARDLVRAPLPLFGRLGMHLNPVASVQNEIEIAPHPPGWLLLAATGPEARLLGSAASEFEARDLARSLQETWSSQGGKIEGMPEIDGESHDEADNVTTSLRGVPVPQPAAAVHVARIGGPWQTLPLERPDAGLQADLRRQGITDAE